MPITQKTVVLNSFGLERRERFKSVTVDTGATQFDTMQSMGARFSVSVDATPMIHRFDAKALGRGPAVAIVDHLRGAIETIGVDASPRTLVRRKQAKKELASGNTNAARRYSGGRIGTLEPNGSEKLFNDSGRFAQGLAASPIATGYVINVTANRLDPSTFRDGEAGVLRLFVQLRQYVPEFGDASRLATVPAIRKAISDSTDEIIARSSWRSSGSVTDIGAARRAATLQVVREALELASALAA